MKMLEGVNVWSRSCDLAANTYSSLKVSDDQVFREHTTRSSLALATNIAEAYELESPEQFCAYLKIARGSCAELRTQLYIAGVVGLIGGEHSDRLVRETLEVSQLLDGLINCFHPDG